MPEGLLHTGSDPDEPGSSTGLAVPGVDLVAAAARATAGERLTAEDYALMMRGVAWNTRLAVRRQWKRVLEWTGEHGYCECPMPVETCVKWVRANWTMTGRYGRPVSPETVQLSLWVITKAHKAARRPDGTRGYGTPVDSDEVRTALRGYRADYIAAGHRSDMASPIEPDEQLDMIGTCDVRSPVGLRDALALALLYDAGFRASELAPRTDPEGAGPGLLLEDVEIHVAGDHTPVDPARPQDIPLTDTDHLVVHVPMSKTDQEGYGDEVFLYAHPPAFARNCPVRLYLAWLELLRRRDLNPRRGPVLRQVMHGNRAPADGRPKAGTVTDVGLRYDGLVRLFGRAVAAAQLDNPEGRRRHLVLHGMRAGSAEAAAERGADTPELNRHFRWSQKGTTAQRYAARGRKRRGNPARRIWGQQPG